MENAPNYLSQVLDGKQRELLEQWKENLKRDAGRQTGLMSEAELDEQCSRFLKLLARAVSAGDLASRSGDQWERLKDLLTEISRTRSTQGYTPTEVATVVFSAKDPIFAMMQEAMQGKEDSETQMKLIWETGRVLDSLGMYTAEVYMRSREEVDQSPATGSLGAVNTGCLLVDWYISITFNWHA